MSHQDASENNIEVCVLDSSFASELAEIHASALKDDVLPAMGKRFLEGYYEYVAKLSHQLIIGCFDKEILCGFCQVSYSPLSMTKLIIASPFSMLHICRLMITKPKLFWRGIRQASQRPRDVAKLQIPEITFIAIKEGWQGQGLGKLMIEHASKSSYQLGIPELFTKTSSSVAKHLYIKHFDAKTLASEKIDGITYWYLSWKTDFLDAL